MIFGSEKDSSRRRIFSPGEILFVYLSRQYTETIDERREERSTHYIRLGAILCMLLLSISAAPLLLLPTLTSMINQIHK